MTTLRTEADVIATLAVGTYQLPKLYELVEASVGFDGWNWPHPGGLQWPHPGRRSGPV